MEDSKLQDWMNDFLPAKYEAAHPLAHALMERAPDFGVSIDVARVVTSNISLWVVLLRAIESAGSIDSKHVKRDDLVERERQLLSTFEEIESAKNALRGSLARAMRLHRHRSTLEIIYLKYLRASLFEFEAELRLCNNMVARGGKEPAAASLPERGALNSKLAGLSFALRFVVVALGGARTKAQVEALHSFLYRSFNPGRDDPEAGWSDKIRKAESIGKKNFLKWRSAKFITYHELGGEGGLYPATKQFMDDGGRNFLYDECFRWLVMFAWNAKEIGVKHDPDNDWLNIESTIAPGVFWSKHFRWPEPWRNALHKAFAALPRSEEILRSRVKGE